jgi:predicted nucleic acid-binding Zn ribbon protein
MEEIRDMKSIINDVVRDLNMGSRLNITNIFNHWEEIVGVEISKKAKPEKIVRNTLYVSVVSSTWANELGMMSNQLIDMINSFIGEEVVKSIKFRQNL